MYYPLVVKNLKKIPSTGVNKVEALALCYSQPAFDWAIKYGYLVPVLPTERVRPAKDTTWTNYRTHDVDTLSIDELPDHEQKKALAPDTSCITPNVRYYQKAHIHYIDGFPVPIVRKHARELTPTDMEHLIEDTRDFVRLLGQRGLSWTAIVTKCEHSTEAAALVVVGHCMPVLGNQQLAWQIYKGHLITNAPKSKRMQVRFVHNSLAHLYKEPVASLLDLGNE